MQEYNLNIIVKIKDFGRGVRDNIKNNLFKPFFSLKNRKVGMGLAVNKSIIRAHGGKVWLQNHSGKETVFGFQLPIHDGG